MADPREPPPGLAGAAHWDARYAGEDYIYGTEPNAFLVSQAHRLRPGMHALAVADGEGRNGVWLAGQGVEVTSLDVSPLGLAKAQALAAVRGAHITTELCDLSRHAWEEARYDLVAAIFIQFADPPLRAAMFAGMQRTLRPGGLLLLEGYRTEQLGYRTGGPNRVENLYTADLLRQAFAGMEILQLDARDAAIAEGAGHAGMSALIDLVARKR